MRHSTAITIALTALPSLAAAQATIVVDRASVDVADFGGSQMVGNLPGPDGRVTLREAVMAASNTPGPQTIAFAIPRSDWPSLDSSQVLIQLEDLLRLSGDDTLVDFTTQTAFTGDTNPNGGEVALHYVGPPAGIPSLWLAAERCTVRGLDRTIGNNFGNGLWISGNHNVVVGCTTNGLLIRGDYGGGAFNRIGGTELGEANRFSQGFNILSGANDNVVIGNTIRAGLRISGDTLYGTCDRNRVVGNALAGNGYYGEEGFPLGTQLEIYHAVDTLVEGNLVGTLDGVNPSPGSSGTGGIEVWIGARNTLVRDNVISAIDMIGANHYAGQHFGVGIGVEASAENTTIVDNKIGLAADGVTPLGNMLGIDVQSNPNGVPRGVAIGGLAPGEANVIAHNRAIAVRVANSATGVAVRGNSIRDNGGLGIDLVGFSSSGAGVTPNDPLDADDFGGNHLQNFPVIQRALRFGRNTLLVGRLDSEPTQAFAIDFYASAALDPTGFGEASVFLGSTTVTTDAAGRAGFATSVPGAPAGWFVTATATQLARGETSELSAGRRQRTPWLME